MRQTPSNRLQQPLLDTWRFARAAYILNHPICFALFTRRLMMDHTEDLTELPIAPGHGIIPVEIPAILDEGRRQIYHELSQNIDMLHNKIKLRKKRDSGNLTIRETLGCLASDCFEAGQHQRLVKRLLEYSDSKIEGMCMKCMKVGRVHATDCTDQHFDLMAPVTSEEGWTPWLREVRKPYWKPCEATTHHGWPALAIMGEAAATELGDSVGHTYGGDYSQEVEYLEPGSLFEEGGCWYLTDRAMGLSSSE
ncbi:hypothetical protein LTR56_004816 [Elasticomyces elasticus]|nr:hypothetical protein LTR56_004816 [Elasticomyces elasticus]KAK3664590.1 hypothetical protein LTR22_004458 [Elasticomyces elasticus]KAK4918443.1 hypothetical protein LTR49_013835 [Elasticomyces elasticus]KAK5760300.1 hypothetical protein LTS12_009514 [Elasticomyces elasticus]